MLRRIFGKSKSKKSPDSPAPAVPDGVQIYAIGDIHGRADLLEGVLSAIDHDREASNADRHIEVYLGDYVDRGPASRKVLDMLIERSAQSPNCIFLKGNHEQTVLRFLDDPSILTTWRNHGGYEFLMSYGVTPPSLADEAGCTRCRDDFRDVFPSAHLRFITQLHVSCQFGDYFFAHAGVRPGRTLDEQTEEDLLWIRGEFLESRENFGKVIVHGHTPVDEPEILTNRINLDTGAFATGRLSCLVLAGTHHRLLMA